MISIPKKIFDSMIEHSKKGFPNEACGILGGSPGKAEIFYPMKNVDESAISYFMDTKEQLFVIKRLREEKMEICGIFHSHVNSEAYPSQKDVRLAFYADDISGKGERIKIFPEASYLIVSLSDLKKPVLRSFRIENEKVIEEKIQVI